MPAVPPCRIALLGPPVLELAGRSHPLAPERRFQLLAFLAHQTDWVSRERLAQLFWPEHAADAARRNLRKVLFRLREWPDAPQPEERAGALRWRVDSDVQAFEAALGEGRPLDALRCWRGEPWADLDRDAPAGLADWLAFERQRLRARWRAALLQLARDTADALTAAGFAQQLIAHDPLDEEAVRACMQAQARAGLAAEARRSYRQFSQALADALGLEPSAATRALLDAPVAPAHDTPDATVPEAPPGFIGRDAELRELQHLLAQPACRWLTLTGPGGIGKSRLLVRALPTLGRESLWVPLEDLTGADQIGPRLCERLGLAAGGADAPMALVRQALQQRTLLLALDNLEHLLAAVPALDGLLRACPGVQLLVTSRERCGAAGEWLLPLLGLPYPAPADADRAEAFDAVRLFVQRACEARPRFTLDAERAAVVELCELTEGLPLAIELAAAWSRHLPVHEIVHDLRSGQLLDEAVPGHRSVAATFEHSWQRMVPAERTALAALSVFRGGFTRNAARHVADASLGVLAALLDKSLLRRDDAAGPARSASRFSLHPLLQQFAHARLALDGAALAQAQRRHAEFFGQLLLRLPPPDQAAAMTAFCREHQPELDNLAAAWLWALAQRRIDLLRDAATPLRIVHYVNARWREGLALLDAAESAVAGDAVALARVNVSRLVLLYNLGRCAEAVALALRMLPPLRRGGEPRMLTTGLFFAGQAELVLGHAEAAQGHFEEALAVARRLEDRLGMSNGLGCLGSIHYLAGRYGAACVALEECVDLRSAMGGDLAQPLSNLGLMQLCNGQPHLAIATFERGLQRCDAEGNPSARAYLHYNLASAQLQLGDPAQAERLAAHCAEHGVDGLAPVLAIQLGLLRARIAGQRGDLPQARLFLLAATADARQRQVEPALLSAAAHWAEWLGQSGEPARAAALLAMVLAQPELEHAERVFAQQVLEAVRARHSAAAHAQALAAGARLTLQTAVDLLPT